jgi:hypothetical protein
MAVEALRIHTCRAATLPIPDLPSDNKASRRQSSYIGIAQILPLDYYGGARLKFIPYLVAAAIKTLSLHTVIKASLAVVRFIIALPSNDKVARS